MVSAQHERAADQLGPCIIETDGPVRDGGGLARHPAYPER
jgi:hypothetical protein